MDGWVRPLISNTLSLYQRDFQLRWKSKKFLYSRGSGFNTICHCKVCRSAYLFWVYKSTLDQFTLGGKYSSISPCKRTPIETFPDLLKEDLGEIHVFSVKAFSPEDNLACLLTILKGVGRTPPYQPNKFPVSRVVNVHWSNSSLILVASSEIGGLKKKALYNVIFP